MVKNTYTFLIMYEVKLKDIIKRITAKYTEGA